MKVVFLRKENIFGLLRRAILFLAFLRVLMDFFVRILGTETNMPEYSRILIFLFGQFLSVFRKWVLN